MITPVELEKIQFEKKLGGYDRASVDEWFTIIKNDYETVYKDNIALRDKIGVLEELISKYRAMEDTMQSSILLAQQTGEKAIAAANSEAEMILSRAREQADAVIRDAKADTQILSAQAENIRGSLTAFVAKNKSLIKSQLEILNQIGSDSLTSTFGQDIKEELD